MPKHRNSEKVRSNLSMQNFAPQNILQIPDDGIRQPAHLIESPHPRFCLEIRHGSPEYARFFTKVFENKTFRIFKVRPKSKTKP